MLSDWAYHLIVSFLEAFMWDGELVGSANLCVGPGVIVAAHSVVTGKIPPHAIVKGDPARVVFFRR